VTATIDGNMAAYYINLQKEVKYNQKQPSCKKVCSPQEGHCEK